MEFGRLALAEVVTIGKNCLAGSVLLLACAALTACDTTTPEEHFASARAQLRTPLRNPHHEPRVSDDQKRDATPAAVLIPIVVREAELTMLLMPPAFALRKHIKPTRSVGSV